MAYIGSKPADKVLTASDITDGVVSTAKIADNAVTADKTSYKDVPFRNIIINGDMSQAQRGTSTASITSQGYYTLDRFDFSPTNTGTWTMSQDTDVPSGQGFARALKLDCTTADASPSASDSIGLYQKIEGQNLQYLKKGTANAESLTVSFWVKSTKTGTFICELYDGDNSRAISQSYTINVSDTWEKKTLTFSGDTTGAFDNDNALSLWFILWLSAGSDLTSGTLETTWGTPVNANRAVGQVNLADSDSNNFWITGVQLEAGTSASDFEFLPVDVNLQRCLRYFQKTYDYADAPAASTDRQKLEISTTSEGGNNAILSLPYKVPLRTTPTVTFYKSDGTAATWTYGRSGASGDASMTAYAGRYGQNHLICYGGVGAGWIACNVAGHYTVSAEL